MVGIPALFNGPLLEKTAPAPRNLTAQEQRTDLNGWQHAAAFVCAFLLLLSRRPDGVLHAQFYAEDGHVWFANAYNLGWWRPLLHPQDGYFQLFPRLGAALALLVPLTLAPLLMNLIAFAMQALPVNLLLSARSAAWGSLRFRALMATFLVALPNCSDISLGITESQWLLALCAFLLLVATPPVGRAGKAFDIAVFVLSGLTGPFCIFLLPVAVAMLWQRRNTWRISPVWMLAPCAALQAAGLLIFAPTDRPHALLGASFAEFSRILGGNIYLGVVIGHNKLAMSASKGVLDLLVFAAIAGTVLAVICFLKSSFPMRSLLLVSAVMFLAALLCSDTRPPQGVSVWQILADTAGGARYWFFPSLAFAWALLWCARNSGRVLKPACVLLLCFSALCVPFRWKRPVLENKHYSGRIANFQAAPAGALVTIPENPAGWQMELIRH